MRGALASALVALAVAVALAAAGCGGPKTFDEPEGNLRVPGGEEFRVELSENPSTGYLWRFARRPDPAVARFLGGDFEADDGGEGAGGTRTLRFRAGERGRTEMTLVRIFTGGARDRDPAEERRLTVEVEP